jgi:Ca2+-transporting ATPase
MTSPIGESELPPFGRDAAAVRAAFATGMESGLTEQALPALRATYGWNELTRVAGESAWQKLWRQFNDLVIWILVAAALTSGLLGDRVDAVVIIAIVLLNGMLGFLQERRAERAFIELEKMAAPMATVIRNGVRLTIAARELLPGDIIELSEGDVVPADARLLEAFALQTQEASLTGESLPVDKVAETVLAVDTQLGDRCNMVYLGTAVTGGRATAIVTAIGMQTELGRIDAMLETSTAAPTPLQRRINHLGRTLVGGCVVLIVLTFGMQVARGGDILKVFLLAVSLAVAAIPEGLPAVVTVSLAIGVRKMARRNALIRRLPSVETLGSVTVICTDKTGTLTRNEMMVREVLAGGRRYQVTGDGYQPQGAFREVVSAESRDAIPHASPALDMALWIGAHCNHARLVPPAPSHGRTAWQVTGDPTEGALLVAALKAGDARDGAGYELVDEMPFHSDRKRMSVTVRRADGAVMILTKGAIEAVLPDCTLELLDRAPRPLSEAARATIAATHTELASRGMRMLILAYQDFPTAGGVGAGAGQMTFAGLVGMIDPPREAVAESVARCWRAGIRPVMITGDHPATATTIARELGIARAESQVLTGREIDQLSDAGLSERSVAVAVYARVTAAHKLRIVRALKARHEVVAMTGDGANDAPAIREADIGIAMGLSGTDVARQSADLVLLDDNFATIVGAVEQGRSILDNIRKFLHYLLAGNAAELSVMFVGAAIGWPFPLLATQLLWINLVTDGPAALALGLEQAEMNVMGRRPLPLNHALLDRARVALIAMHAALIAAATLAAFAITYAGDPANIGIARTTAFATLAFSQIFFALNCRSDTEPVLYGRLQRNHWLLVAIAVSAAMQLAVLSIPAIMHWFDVTVAPSRAEWRRIAVFSMIPFTVIEGAKMVRRALIRVASSDAPAQNPLVRALFIVLAAGSLVLGLVGLVAPVIPGVVFLALGALFLTRVSERWRRWLHGRSWYLSLRKRMPHDGD